MVFFKFSEPVLDSAENRQTSETALLSADCTWDFNLDFTSFIFEIMELISSIFLFSRKKTEK